MIRAALPSDANTIRNLITRAYAPWQKRLPDLPDVTDGIEIETAEGRLWVKVADHRIIAVLNAGQNGRSFHIMNIAVDTDQMGKGHGKALLAHATAKAIETGCTHMVLATHSKMESNIAFYAALGWTVTSRDGNKVRMRYDLEDA